MFSWNITTIALLCGVCLSCYSADQGGTAVLFSGRVVDKNPCAINNDNQIIVPFNNVSKDDADGKKIQKKLDITIKCTNEYINDDLKMQIIGSSSVSDYILDTSMKDMGIMFYSNGVPVKLHTWFNLPSPAESLFLTASPALMNKNDVDGGEFTASATLLVNIQ